MCGTTWPAMLTSLLRGDHLTSDQTAWAMEEIIKGDATAAQIAGFIVALRAKGETPDELSGLVNAVLRNAVRVSLDHDAVDVVGTGGDRSRTVNISTMAAIVVAGAGLGVVKHGGRAVSSACGSADVVAELGIPLDLGPGEVASCVARAGIGFCFAPRFHAGLRHAAPTRRELGVPSIFNFLAPLINPAQPKAAAIGSSDPRMASVMADVFAKRGASVLIVHGEDGLDEVTTTAPTRIWAVSDGRVAEQIIDVAEFGISRSIPSDLVGGDAAYNADVVRNVIGGEKGPIRDAVVVNAAAAFAAYDGFGQSVEAAMKSGIERACAAIDSGAAADTLAKWVRTAKQLSAADVTA